jgi:hypothetical protein
MILVAGGDSFIWGSELADSPSEDAGGYSCKTFPALLAQQTNMDYVCAAYPGNANDAISRMAIDALSKLDSDKFLLVQWTYPQRREFRFDNKWISINSWHTEQKEFSELYFKMVGNNEYYEVYSILKEILFLQCYCTTNNIQYMFMTADNHFYCHPNYERHSTDSSVRNLFTQIDWSRWFFFPAKTQLNETLAPRGFYQWAIENKYTIAPRGHPLEQAHKDASLIIKEKFDELVNKNL